MAQPKTEWIALGYSVPANPSRGRVYVWRRLRALGAQWFRPGMAVLPNSRENLEQFELLSRKITEFSGEAVLLEVNFLTPGDDEQMRLRFAEASAQAARAALDECAGLLARMNAAPSAGERSELARRLKKALGQLEESPLRTLGGQAAGEIEQAFGELMGTLRSMPGELTHLLYGEKKR
ncbi:MAG: hypothetical protein RR197_03600 [Oscillospiraceae bacterium]